MIKDNKEVNLVTLLEDFFIEHCNKDRTQGNILANFLLDRLEFCKLDIIKRKEKWYERNTYLHNSHSIYC